MILRPTIRPVIRPVIGAAINPSSGGPDSGFTYLRDPLDGGAIVKDGIDHSNVQDPK